MNAAEFIKYLKSIGLEVNTSTKARGHQGFYMKNRIDISRNISDEMFMPTLVHEFAHYIHSRIEPFTDASGGTVEAVFDDDNSGFYMEELLKVTGFTDKNSKCEKLLQHKQALKEKIAEYEKTIKERYPNFMRSKKFKEFDRYIKGSNAKYLLKYDRVKLITPGAKTSTVVYSTDSVEKDFCDMPKEFAAYIKLRSCQRKQTRIASKINRLNKYYSKPTELFARFVEGLYLNSEKVKELAPNCYKRFYELLNCGYYRELSVINYLKPNNELNIL